METIISRRDLLQIGYGTAAALGASGIAGELSPVRALAQNNAYKVGNAPPTASASGAQLFYRDDFFGEPWHRPEPALLIHGVGESSIVWYGWMPRMAQQFRVLRPDLPGFGSSKVPNNFQWSLANLAKVLAQFLDSLGIDSAHIVGAKLGGSIAMQFAADYPRRTRTLVVASSPVSTPKFAPEMGEHLGKKWIEESQRNRLGSAASKEQVEYWIRMMNAMDQRTRNGIDQVTASLNLEPILPRIAAPTLVITADRSYLQSVETVLNYQKKIPKSRLLVLSTDAYHVAVAKADECVASVLSFVQETKA